ncbi:MAG: winged helix-turn-helix domain-containing protein [Mycobacterium sp.]|uniref:winged helix-turn-helix domain-containing protein n=1 Tax=Mycobacterium sp. TaxID=1785 RepID=UPI0026173B0B|nr:winged helix-turn-helix domain-containing protein [Mycobacterium sp.]MDI3314540.1 winged helix-turn-helix domain-containing protein [Mycobacterium sp.]
MIDLDPDIFEYLQSRAKPFIDTPSTVLRRELGLPDPPTAPAGAPASKLARAASNGAPPKTHKTQRKQTVARKRTRAAAGTLLPEDRYRVPLLRALVDAGGQAHYRDVANAVGHFLKDELKPADFEMLDSGVQRWQNRLQFVRLDLVKRGLLQRDMPRGIWAISDAGRKALEEGQVSSE